MASENSLAITADIELPLANSERLISRIVADHHGICSSLRDLYKEGIEKVRIDSRETFVRLVEFAETFVPEMVSIIEHYSGERPLFDIYNVEDENRVRHATGGKLPVIFLDTDLPENAPGQGDNPLFIWRGCRIPFEAGDSSAGIGGTGSEQLGFGSQKYRVWNEGGQPGLPPRSPHLLPGPRPHPHLLLQPEIQFLIPAARRTLLPKVPDQENNTRSSFQRLLAILGSKQAKGAAFGVLLSAGIGLLLITLPAGDKFRYASYDLPFVHRPDIIPTEVAMVYLDDASHTRLNQKYTEVWNRAFFTALLKRLTREHAKAVVFDIVFSDALDPKTDADFADAIRENGKVVLAADWTFQILCGRFGQGRRQGIPVPLAAL